MAMLEQGSRVMSAVHKRMHYAMRIEFKILARVMSESLPQEYPYSVAGDDAMIMASDFDDRVDVIPVSNPNVFSQSQRILLAQTKMQLAAAAPQLHNMHEVYRDMYDALGVTDVDRIMVAVPDSEPQPMDPAQENIDALDMLMLKAFEGQDHQAHIMAHLVFGSSPMVGSLPPVALTLQKHILEHIKIESEEQAAIQMQQGQMQQGQMQQGQMQQGQMQQGQMQQQRSAAQDPTSMDRIIAQLVAQGMQKVKQLSAQISGEGQQGPDPLIQLKEKELQIKAQSEQNDAQIDAQKMQLDTQSLEMRKSQFGERLAAQERQTAARIDSAMQRELLKKEGR
jgi:hypothetical protein